MRITSYVFCMEGVGKIKRRKKRQRQVKDKGLKKLYAKREKKTEREEIKKREK